MTASIQKRSARMRHWLRASICSASRLKRLISLTILATGSTAISSPAHASDWGCQVVLCLATPGSPTTYTECVPPITKLWSTLASGGGFPNCIEGGVAAINVQRNKYWPSPLVTETFIDGHKEQIWLGQNPQTYQSYGYDITALTQWLIGQGYTPEQISAILASINSLSFLP